jgi:drug/metabolite transporter (DMT)-like permease
LANISVAQIIFFRSVFSIIITYFVIQQLQLSPWGNNIKWLLVRGFVGMCSLLSFFYAIKLLPLGTAVTIGNLVPLFTLLLAHFFLKEKVPLFSWITFIVSFLGVVLLKGLDPLISTLGIVMAVSAAFFTASAHFTVRQLRATDHTQVIMFYFPLVTIPLITPFAWYSWKVPTFNEWWLLILIGVFTHIGQLYLTKAYQNEEVKNIAYVYYLGVVLSFVYGIVFFDEFLSVQSLVGIGLILLGVLFNLKRHNIPPKQ